MDNVHVSGAVIWAQVLWSVTGCVCEGEREECVWEGGSRHVTLFTNFEL